MPRSSERRPSSAQAPGFSLIEIIVALGIISLVVTALLPQLIIGIKATRTAQLVTQAKALAQGELEEMRNLPYRVAPDAGPYIDVLDRFYPNTTAPETSPANAPDCRSGEGYVMPASADVPKWEGFVADATVPGVACSYEPQAGPFYRTVEERVDSELGRIVIVTDTQFLKITQADLQPTPVAPTRADYNSGTTGLDSPPTSQIGVTLTVLYTEGQRARAATTYTQIAQRISSPARLDARVEATAFEITSTDESEAAVSMTAGVMTLAASLTHASTASADLASVAGRRASTASTTGTTGDGAAETLVAPPVQASAAPTEGAGCVDPATGLLCWGASSLGPAILSLTTADALPNVGEPTSPLQTRLTGSENSGLSFDNTMQRPDGSRYAGILRAPLVSFAASTTASAGCTTPASGYATAGGYIDTTTTTVDTCGQAHAGVISLLTTTEPDGLVEIELHHAWARCQQGTTTPTDFGYSVTVKVNDAKGGPWTRTISKGSATTLPAPGTIELTSGEFLDKYIASWDALTDTEVSTSADGASTVSLPGVLTVLTQNVRRDDDPAAPDKPSDLKLTVGSVSCSAKDER